MRRLCERQASRPRHAGVLHVFVEVDVLQCLGVLAFQALEELHGGTLFFSWTGSGAVCSFVRELVSEHRKPAFRGGSRGFVLNDVPMLSEDTVRQAHQLHQEPIQRYVAEPRKKTTPPQAN